MWCRRGRCASTPTPTADPRALGAETRAAGGVAVLGVIALGVVGLAAALAGCPRDPGAQAGAGATGTPPKPAWTASDRAEAERLAASYRAAPGAVGTPPAAPRSPPAAQALVGRPLPVRRFLGVDGRVLDLEASALRSKRLVLLAVLRGDPTKVCIYCSAQTLALHDEAARLRAAGVEPVLVYPGPAAAAAVFVAAAEDLRDGLAISIPVAMDVDLALVRALGVEDRLAFPTSLLVAPDGTIRYAYVGQDFADRPTIEALLAAAAAATAEAAPRDRAP